ncbi:transcription initiation factor TFIID subunit 8-like [Chenopodium quinoa]|uniref:transcription initiation factor TFIID subunit 8-like n=1 Tax=Chenopodium quinoa TaxID=63459 RepID=UPI000B785386|nr:transcription initiation factor TFIID subunit 8-like [Chenopodium quinoa]
MSDGGKEIGKEFEQQSTRKPAGNEDFVRTIAKIAVAQLCENEGFHGFQHSALEAFADVAVRYMKELGKTSNHYANQGGRSECNVFDVIRGLEDLGSIQGFPGASDVHRSLAKSGIVREISQYVGLVDGIPFVFSLPRFPVSRERRNSPSSFLQMGKDPPEHIPPWLPAFPFSGPRGESPGLGEGETDGHSKEIAQEEARKKEEAELMNIQQQQQQEQEKQQQQEKENQQQQEQEKQQQLQQEQQQLQQEQQQQQQQQQQLAANNGSEAVLTNPYLIPPFAYGEKAVSSVEFPSRHWDGIHHVNVMDTYAPIAETARNEFSEIKEMDKQVSLDERPTVRLKFSSGRKSLRTSKNVVAQTKGCEKISVLFERDDENDEKKRRAEQILKDSMETPLDTTEL